MNPYLKLAIRVTGAGLLACAGALRGHLPGFTADEIIDSVLVGIIAAGLFGGLELGTPVNSTIGAFKK